MAEADISLEVLVKQRLEEEDTWWTEYLVPMIIFRVPANIRKANKSLYEPRMVSIGPYYYHLRKDRLRAMEDHKWRLLKSFLFRNNMLGVETCIKVLRSLEKKVRQSYSEHITLGQDELIQMLLLDGCFILELFFKWLHQDSDVLFKEGQGPTTIFSDLLLFENQIPLVVLESLYDIVLAGKTGFNRDTLLSLLAKFLMEDLSHTSDMTWLEKKVDHLLDLCHQFLIVPSLCQEKSKHDSMSLPLWKQWLIHWTTLRRDKRGVNWPSHKIPSATELQEAGVKFRKRQSPKSSLDVNFSRGILEIPTLQIYSNKNAILTNLVELEKYKTWDDRIVTSYVTLMVSLINTKEDVALLQQTGVIDNMLYSHQEAVVLFNQLAQATPFVSKNHHFAELFSNVRLYYNSKWNRSWARLIDHDYFNSPWAVISVFAAVILLTLTTIQTFYTVYPYYVPG